MGMKRRYIQKRFDEIVGYSGVEQFIDTPVKRYSSGMYVRLAFAVAAHLEPDILIVDEVLSVGDSHFQKKCLGKMQDASRGEGRTILFVSHNLNAIATFCDRAILLADGKISFEGNDVARVIDSYQTRELGDSQKYQWKRDSERFDSVYFRPVSLELIDKLGNAINRPIRNNEKVRVRIVFDSTMLDNAFNVGYALYDQLGVLQYMSVTTDGPENEWPKWHAGRNCAFSELPQRLLNEGTYTIELIASLHCTTWLIAPSAEGPSITVSIEGGLSDSPYWLSKRPGALGPVVRWRTEDEE
jgi:lipopolysaccharide transport system ATP-binding protein